MGIDEGGVDVVIADGLLPYALLAQVVGIGIGTDGGLVVVVFSSPMRKPEPLLLASPHIVAPSCKVTRLLAIEGFTLPPFASSRAFSGDEALPPCASTTP